jgi:hypothetical protein
MFLLCLMISIDVTNGMFVLDKYLAKIHFASNKISSVN